MAVRRRLRHSAIRCLVNNPVRSFLRRVRWLRVLADVAMFLIAMTCLYLFVAIWLLF